MLKAELLLLEERLWLLTSPTGLPIYDFDFRTWFRTRMPLQPPEQITAVARVGAVTDYNRFYDECKDSGIALIHSPKQYRRATQLDGWYPLMPELTPPSVCFHNRPTLEQVKAKFE